MRKLLAFLSAACLFLSAVEYSIPKPLPFLRLGLANLPLVIALHFLDAKNYLILIVLKILGQNLISGTLFSYVCVFSICGSFASGIGMLILYKAFFRRGLISNTGISIGGSLLNSLAQLAVANLILFPGTDAAKFIAPVLLGSSLVTGILLGLFAEKFYSSSEFVRLVKSERQVEK